MSENFWKFHYRVGQTNKPYLKQENNYILYSIIVQSINIYFVINVFNEIIIKNNKFIIISVNVIMITYNELRQYIFYI